MKNLLFISAVIGAFAAFAGIESQQVTAKGYVPRVGGKIVHVDVLSSTAAASIDVKSVSEITCSGGRGVSNPENTYVVPGDKVIYDGDESRVILFIEK